METNPRQQLQQQLDDAYRRGQLDETVRTLQTRLSEITTAIHDIQETMGVLSKNSVSLQRFEALEITVRGLERWKWGVSAVLAAALTMSQVLPRLIDLLKSRP